MTGTTGAGSPLVHPRILFLADRPGSNHAVNAATYVKGLPLRFQCQVVFASERPCISRVEWDLVYVLDWREKWHRRFGFEPKRIIKEVSSDRLDDVANPPSAAELQKVHRACDDAGTILCTTTELAKRLSDQRRRVRRVSHTVPAIDSSGGKILGSTDLEFLVLEDKGEGRDKIWRQLLRSKVKSSSIRRASRTAFRDMAKPAGPGVVILGSSGEDPQTELICCLADGLFPIARATGLSESLIVPGTNGLIVSDAPAEMAAAIDWCLANVDAIAAARQFSPLMLSLDLTAFQERQPLEAVLWETMVKATMGGTERYPDELSRIDFNGEGTLPLSLRVGLYAECFWLRRKRVSRILMVNPPPAAVEMVAGHFDGAIDILAAGGRDPACYNFAHLAEEIILDPQAVRTAIYGRILSFGNGGRELLKDLSAWISPRLRVF